MWLLGKILKYNLEAINKNAYAIGVSIRNKDQFFLNQLLFNDLILFYYVIFILEDMSFRNAAAYRREGIYIAVSSDNCSGVKN